MPNYDYSCVHCGREFEVNHPMLDVPVVACPECGGDAKRIFSPCGIVVRGGATVVRDKLKRISEAKQDLRENFGVQTVRPVDGSSMLQVYNDIRKRGSEVRDGMQRKCEESASAKKKKDKAWRAQAQKRANVKSRDISERKKREEASGRRIVL